MSALLEDGDHLGLLVRMFPAGEIAFRATIYQGQHERIVDLARWDRVNAKLVDRGLDQQGRPHQKDKSPLAGILYCRTWISDATDLDQPLIKAASTSKGPRGKRTQLCGIISLIVQATRVANRSLSYPCSKKRCAWVFKSNSLMLEYHDREWGVPVHDDNRHFEFLVLQAAQAGLSWSLVLNKREGYRRAFSGFDPGKVARYTEKRVQKLLLDARIIRNRQKIEAAVRNARAFLAIQEEFGSFDAYSWYFVDGQPKVYRWRVMKQIPATSTESDAFSKDLKHRGFSFVGSTVIYAHMQAVGMVNDHLVDCFRYREVATTVVA